MAQTWAFQSASLVSTGYTVFNQTANLPATYSTGSLLILVAVCSAAITTSVTGYTNVINNSTGTNLAVWYKFATSGSETAPTVAVLNADVSVVMLAYSGISAFDASSSIANQTINGAGSSNCTTNTFTTGFNDDLVLSIYGAYYSSPNTSDTLYFGTPSGTTSRSLQVGSGGTSSTRICGFLIADEDQATAGTSTARTSSASKSGPGTSITTAQIAIGFKQTVSSNLSNFFFMF